MLDLRCGDGEWRAGSSLDVDHPSVMLVVGPYASAEDAERALSVVTDLGLAPVADIATNDVDRAFCPRIHRASFGTTFIEVSHLDLPLRGDIAIRLLGEGRHVLAAWHELDEESGKFRCTLRARLRPRGAAFEIAEMLSPLAGTDDWLSFADHDDADEAAVRSLTDLEEPVVEIRRYLMRSGS